MRSRGLGLHPLPPSSILTRRSGVRSIMDLIYVKNVSSFFDLYNIYRYIDRLKVSTMRWYCWHACIFYSFAFQILYLYIIHPQGYWHTGTTIQPVAFIYQYNIYFSCTCIYGKFFVIMPNRRSIQTNHIYDVVDEIT